MKAEINFEGVARDNLGKGSARAARREGKIPAVIYSKSTKPVHFMLNTNEVIKEYNKGRFMSKIVSLKIDGKEHFALAKELKSHPVSDMPEHADFLAIDAKSKVRVAVPVEFLNRERSVGIKRGGVLNIVRHRIELLCEAANIPSSLSVDIKDFGIGDSVHMSHFTLPAGCESVITDRDFTVATVTGRKAKEEDLDAPVTAEGEEGEAAEGTEGEASEEKSE